MLRNTLSLMGLILCIVGSVYAQQMVSICAEKANMRAGPGTGSQVRWELGRDYPLRVLTRKGNWLKISDFEGDRGWVFAKLTCRRAHMIVKGPKANIRSGPGTGYRIVGGAEYGEVFRTLEKQGRWVRVAATADGRSGWIARSLLWGW